MIGKEREKPFYLSTRDADYILEALIMYVDYLRDGDDDEKEMAQYAIKVIQTIKEQY